MAATSEPSQWRHSIVPGLMSYLDAGSIITMSIALVLLQESLGISAWGFGFLTGLLTAAFAVGAFVGGRISDLWGRKRVFLVNLAMYIVGAGIVIVASTAAWLYPGIGLMGVAMGIGVPTSLALIAESAAEGTKGKMVGLSSALWLVGIMGTLGLATGVAQFGPLGARILMGHMVLIAAIALVLGFGLHESQEWKDARAAGGSVESTKIPLSTLFTKRLLGPLVALTAFFTLVNLPANTLGQYMTYLYVNVAGVDASKASLLGLLGLPVGLVGAVIFMRFADKSLRKPLFVGGAILQVVAFGLPAAFGVTQWTVFLMAAIAGFGGAFAGEGIYKVWSQELFPTMYRATAQGFTYGVTRGITAGFAVITPALIAYDPAVLLWILTAMVAVAGVVGGIAVQRMGAERGADPWLVVADDAEPQLEGSNA
ncbi:MFS transporter [Demequina salsinemoris]|uniref:MFS transporter n=1 Tax=Demequina salsinemoris TaxID=577470 RepID=UPI000785E96A|nr:MFS transporter [Demequina salsinemoris]